MSNHHIVSIEAGGSEPNARSRANLSAAAAAATSSGIHQRAASDVAPPIPLTPSSPRLGEHDSSRWSFKLVQDRYRRVQRDGFSKGLFGPSRPLRGTPRSTRTPMLPALEEGSLTPKATLRDRVARFMSMFYANGHDTTRTSVHDDADGALSPGMPSTLTFPPSSSSTSSRRKPAILSRSACTILTILFILGLRELMSLSRFSNSSRVARARRRSGGVSISRTRRPLSVLAEYDSLSPAPRARSLPGIESFWLTSPSSLAEDEVAVEGDTTAVVLHWKRTENVKVIVAHLCRYDFVQEVLVWNNNPEIRLSSETFKASQCPPSKLRIFNSPRNMLFFARYLACAQSSTPNCFFQDDDWLVRPLRAMYSQFSRDPEGPVVVNTNERTAGMYSLEWCFFNQQLHTCFAWVGTGAFVSRSHVSRFVATISQLDYSREMLGHADNSFTLFQNEPPYVLASKVLDQLPSPFGHSDGEGIARNKRYIHQGLVHLSSYLASSPSSATAKLPVAPIRVDTTPYIAPRPPPLARHPYAHHARSPCADDTCVFVTNVALLPPPDSVPYPGAIDPSAASATTNGSLTGLEEWENHLGHLARGWMETGQELFNEEETWLEQWGYAGAVDGETDTVFRSPDVVKANDYVGIGLLSALDASWLPRVTLAFMIEDVEQVLPLLVVEVSSDGYHWYEPPTRPAPPVCKPSRQRSTAPDLSFPLSCLSSPLSRKIRLAEETANSSRLSAWWTRRRRRGRRIQECKIDIETAMYEESQSTAAGDEEGWRFVRLRSRVDGRVGWGLYEIWVESSGDV